MSWIRETIHNFSCVFCNQYWSIALEHGAEYLLRIKSFIVRGVVRNIYMYQTMILDDKNTKNSFGTLQKTMWS